MLYHRPILTPGSSPCGSVTATEATSSGRSQSWISRASQSTTERIGFPCSMHHQSLRHHHPNMLYVRTEGSRAWSHAFGSVPRARCCCCCCLAVDQTRTLLATWGDTASCSRPARSDQDAEPCLLLGHRGCSFACGCFCRSTPHSAQLPHRSCKRTGPLPGSARCSFFIGEWSLVAGVPRETLSVCTGQLVKLWEFLVGSKVPRVE